ncbi:MAG TPA: ABC transporter ATP-binding protein [Pyrinomonadaceae bacterium]|jgi:lipooligosaccharide transport system ATP-binding protein
MSYVIEARNLTKRYKEFVAVNDITFDVEAGETFSILGENGAGKSTTMRMIACRSPLTSGSLRVNHLDVTKHEREIRALIGVVPQENNLDPDLNVKENLLVYARYFRLPKNSIEDRCDELLDFIRLTEKKDAKVDHLSGGMKRRLIIARALLHRPKILLLDEPTTGLDPNVRQEIWEKLEELRDKENLSIILSTHYMDEAEKLSSRLIILSNGKIISEGIPKEIVERNVKRFALEIRGLDRTDLSLNDDRILVQRRGGTHIFFAETMDELTSLLKDFDSRQVILRPSNLEDVFLQFIKN